MLYIQGPKGVDSWAKRYHIPLEAILSCRSFVKPVYVRCDLNLTRAWCCASSSMILFGIQPESYGDECRAQKQTPLFVAYHAPSAMLHRPYPAVWSDGQVSLAGFMSMQWARQEVHLTAVEYLGLALLVGYAVVYIAGRRRNYRIAQHFIKSVHGLFCSRFL